MAIIHLSQGYLNLLTTCPRQFQYTYLDHLDAPATPEQQARMAWGTQFHVLMQQQQLGLRIDPFLASDPGLNRTLQALKCSAPQLFQELIPPSERSVEHHRTLMVTQGEMTYLLTVVYDLLLLEPDQACILDWKTYSQPPQSLWLSHNWQTRLYPYVLAETSHYAPAQITMTYWFVPPAKDGDVRPPTSRNFLYGDGQHRKTHEDLVAVLSQLTHWLHAFQDGAWLPQVPESAGHCRSCSYAVRCQRHQPYQTINWQQALTEAEEVALP